MPRLSDTMEEGTVSTGSKVGDEVKEGDIIAEVKLTRQQWSLSLFIKEL